jgi:hypothetical protein
MILVDASAHFEHGKLIRCDSKPGSLRKSVDLENTIISKGIPKGPNCHTPPYFFKHGNINFKA